MIFSRKKTLSEIHTEYEEGYSEGNTGNLKRVLRVKDLTFLGIAAVIGAGIFSTIGKASYDGGPGVIFLFIITALTCGFSALCYAEFASRVPVSGSAYTYSYVAFGEIIAWIIGWALILEYSIGNIVVAISWSAYFNHLLEGFGIHLPDWLSVGYQTAKIKYDATLASGGNLQELIYTHAPTIFGIKFIINLPAFLVTVLVTILAYIGISESKKSANFMVWLKLAVLAFVVVIGLIIIVRDDLFYNWTPFLPNGMDGVLKGVSSVFFAYIGFDAISTTAEECANPKRDLPRGMLLSLIICTIIYVVVALVITGLVNYKEFEGVTDPLAFVFNKLNMQKIGIIVAVSAVVASTSVLLVFQIGQPRIWMMMSRDGLMPKKFSTLNKKYKTPGFATIMTGLLVGIPVLFIDDLLMTDLTSIGTLFAFILVCGGVLLLPKVKKEKNKFQLPYINSRYFVPILAFVFLYAYKNRISTIFTHIRSDNFQEILFLFFTIILVAVTILCIVKQFSLIPILGSLFCLYLMTEIPVKSWIAFLLWMAIGLTLYYSFGRKNSVIGKKKNNILRKNHV